MTNFLEKELPTGKGEAAVAKSLDGVLLPEDPKDVLIHELQTELAELKLQHITSVSQAIELQAEAKRLKNACQRMDAEVCQTLGKALDYPWFKDDLKNFPTATELDGVCVGDHVAESLAQEAATTIAKLKEDLETERIRLAGCGVAALMNTRAGIPERIQRDNPYWSESYGDVCRAVDEQISLREEVCKLKAERREFGMRVALAVYASATIYEQSEGEIAAIVEQELNK